LYTTPRYPFFSPLQWQQNCKNNQFYNLNFVPYKSPSSKTPGLKPLISDC
jgi:hypothetical protein